MKIVWFIIFASIMSVASAAEIFPKGCTPVVVNEELVKLSAEVPSLVMIHNLSNMDLWVTHPVSDPSASAGWSSHLQAGNWSALALNEKSFELSCIESRPGHEQQIPCAGVLAACQMSPVTTPKNASMAFWAGENMTLKAILAHVGSEGFGLPKKAQ